jgi:galactokinase
MNPRQAIIDHFKDIFDRSPEWVSNAGGRVNIIGEHTDYHDGFVFPAAIDLRTWAAGRHRDDGVVRIYSRNEKAWAGSSLKELAPTPGKADWRSYVLGPIWALIRSGQKIAGADIIVDGEVPYGGGLSSSASVEVSLVGLAAGMAGVEITQAEAARIARLAENKFCHVPCGIMDQMASACGREGRALLLDCRSLEIDLVPIPGDWVIVVADSGVRHSVGGGEYAERQRQCASGLEKIKAAHPGVKAARDVTLDMLKSMKPQLQEIEYRRLHHAVSENERCLEARDALKRGDTRRVGELLAGSHRSLAVDYEVSCPELDALVDAACASPGVIGARLTGAGFGGNTVNLVFADRAEDFRASLEEKYFAKTGKKTVTRVVRPSEGLVVEKVE